jgi:hypothetical protein
LLERREFDASTRVSVTPLSPDDAIGARADPEFVIKRGKERVIEARLGTARGQSFTDRPSHWNGTLTDALTLDLSQVHARAVSIAILNAALRSLGLASGTVHCRDEDPTDCGPRMAQEIETRFGQKRIGLIGLQPAILEALIARFGSGDVRVLDLNPDNIGEWKSGIEVLNGETDLSRLVDWCEVGLATGSSIVNGTIDEILSRFKDAGKPLIFYGNTISGTAALLDLERICPFSS